MKNSRKSKKPDKRAKNLGRNEAIKHHELVDRYRSLKHFLDSNWGRIGLELKRIRKPDDVISVFKAVPGFEYCLPFRDQQARCFLAAGDIETDPTEIRRTRKQRDDARTKELQLSLESNTVWQRWNEANIALDRAVSDFEKALSFYPFQVLLFVIAKELGVSELRMNANRLEASLREACRKRQEIETLLLAQEGWFARNELVKFTKNHRYEKSSTNFARAMAGLPEWGWLYSLRKCSEIPDESPSATNSNLQLLELLEMIIRKVKPINLHKIEMMLRKELFTEQRVLLKAYLEPNWPWMKYAIADCRGKRFSREELHFKIMARFFVNMERSKMPIEIEIARREQLIKP